MSVTKLSQDLAEIVRSPTVSRPKVVAQLYGEDRELQTAFDRLIVELRNNQRRRDRIGETLGNYELKSILGHGGMATVYLAERADRSYSQSVAIKVLESDLPESFKFRLRAERRILATLTHPSIARLLDAGETSDGIPYLIMEYVRGQKIDRYCDDRALGIHARIELIEKVCEAVTCAHHNLIVHCDLKPSNIVVGEDASQRTRVWLALAPTETPPEPVPDPAAFSSDPISSETIERKPHA